MPPVIRWPAIPAYAGILKVIAMTATQHPDPRPGPTPGSALWRAVRCAARAVRAAHDEQVRMWELWWLTSRAAVDRPGPLAWTPSLDGWRLVGSYLPDSGDAGAGGRP
jgi:hypothetical protein